jgi:hypothetical protein
MSRTFVRPISTSFVGFSFAVGAAFAQQPSSHEEQLLQLENGYCTAQLKRDSGWHEKYLAEDYMGVNSRGASETKADVLASLKDPQNTQTSCLEKDMKVRVHGDHAAVVTGREIFSGTYNGKIYKDVEVLWTDTFFRQDGRWQVVASQATVVTK